MAKGPDTATFAVKIDGEQAKSGADDVAGALEQLQEKIAADEEALKGFQLALRRLKGDGGASKELIDKLKTSIAATKASIGASTTQFLKLGGTFKTVKKGKEAVGGIDALKQAATGATGPIGQFSKSILGLTKLTASGVAAFGLVGIAVAIVAVTAAMAAAIGMLAKYAVMTANARRAEALRLEGLSKYRNFWAEMIGFQRKADSADFLQKTVDNASASVALARGEVEGLTAEFYRAGLRAGNLQDAVEAGAIALATQGQAGLEQFKAMAMSAAAFGGSIRKVSNDIKARLGGVAARQLLDINVQILKLKENFARIFGGLRIEGLAKGFKVITDMFSQSTRMGRTLKALAEGMFNPLFDAVGKNGILVKRFFQGALIAGLMFANFLLDIRDVLRKVFNKDSSSNIDLTTAAIYAGGAAVAVLAGFLATAALSAGILVGSLYLIGKTLTGTWNLIKGFYQIVTELPWKKVGASIIDGIIEGIMSKVDAVVDSIKAVGSAIENGFKGRMAIHSPSRVMFKRGDQTAQGAEKGIEAGTPAVHEAGREMGDIPDLQAPKVKSEFAGSSNATPIAQQSSAPGQQSFTFGDIILQGAPNDSTGNWAAELRREIVRMFQGTAITIGAKA